MPIDPERSRGLVLEASAMTVLPYVERRCSQPYFGQVSAPVERPIVPRVDKRHALVDGFERNCLELGRNGCLGFGTAPEPV